MDITTVNKLVREHLDRYNLTQVELAEPMFDGVYWHVLITLGDKVLGTVMLDSEGIVLENVSYPK